MVKRFTISLSDDLYRQLKAEADQNNNTINGEIGHCLSLFFARKSKVEIIIDTLLERVGQTEKSAEQMLTEAIQAKLYPVISWSETGWHCEFDIDGSHCWFGADEDFARAIKRAYFAWKDKYFDEDVD